MEPASPEAAYRAILETAIDGQTIDVQGRIVAHNAAACRMFGYGSDDLLGAPWRTSSGRRPGV